MSVTCIIAHNASDASYTHSRMKFIHYSCALIQGVIPIYFFMRNCATRDEPSMIVAKILLPQGESEGIPDSG
jgi:hypothetical protein